MAEIIIRGDSNMDDKFRMKREFELKEGLYFVHGYYLSGWRENDIEELYRDQMILMQDSMDDILMHNKAVEIEKAVKQKEKETLNKVSEFFGKEKA